MEEFDLLFEVGFESLKLIPLKASFIISKSFFIVIISFDSFIPFVLFIPVTN